MQITITQDELETAVKDYIATLGITRAVGDIRFIASRGAGEQKIVTEIELTRDAPAVATAPGKVIEASATLAPVKVPATTPAAEPESSEEDEPVAEGDEEEALPPGQSLFS
jgi:hypothetical protein